MTDTPETRKKKFAALCLHDKIDDALMESLIEEMTKVENLEPGLDGMVKTVQLARIFKPRAIEKITKILFDHRHEEVCSSYAHSFVANTGDDLARSILPLIPSLQPHESLGTKLQELFDESKVMRAEERKKLQEMI